jgi:hypothetical protein
LFSWVFSLYSKNKKFLSWKEFLKFIWCLGPEKINLFPKSWFEAVVQKIEQNIDQSDKITAENNLLSKKGFRVLFDTFLGGATQNRNFFLFF